MWRSRAKWKIERELRSEGGVDVMSCFVVDCIRSDMDTGGGKRAVWDWKDSLVEVV